MRDKLKDSVARFSDTFDISSQGFEQDSLERRKSRMNAVDDPSTTIQMRPQVVEVTMHINLCV